MNINDFAQEMARIISDRFGSSLTVSVSSVTKNNGVVLNAIVLKKDNVNAAPVIYLDNFYSRYTDGAKMCDLADEIVELYLQNELEKDVDIHDFTQYERARDNLRLKLINYERNIQMLATIPYIKYKDLAAVAYVDMHKMGFGRATVLVNKKHLDMWKISQEELMETAKRNTLMNMECVVQSIGSMLAEVNPRFLEEEADICSEMKVYVVTNENKMFGAIFMLMEEKLYEFYELFGGDYVIIPSSIHELIICPVNEDTQLDEIGQMIRQINSSELQEEEILSDHAYLYSHRDGVLLF